jgi:hypothetical protein
MAHKTGMLAELIVEGYLEPLKYAHSTVQRLLAQVERAPAAGGLVVKAGPYPKEADWTLHMMRSGTDEKYPMSKSTPLERNRSGRGYVPSVPGKSVPGKSCPWEVRPWEVCQWEVAPKRSVPVLDTSVTLR